MQDEESRRDREALLRDIKRKELRRQRKRAQPDSIWRGLGTFGIVGWSVAIPTLIGIAVAVWANTIWPGTWTLSFFFLGLALGLWNAWVWIERERKIHHQTEDLDEDLEEESEYGPRNE
jgi:ATP synthase protein I